MPDAPDTAVRVLAGTVTGRRSGGFAPSWDEVAAARKLLDELLKAATVHDKTPRDVPYSALLEAVRAVLELDPEQVRPGRWPAKQDPRLEDRWVPDMVEGRMHFADQMAVTLAAVLCPGPGDRPETS